MSSASAPDSPRPAIGVLGSAFNPPHLGHLALAQEALWQLGLAEVVLVPTGEAPHKRIHDDPGRELRLAMTRLAAADDSRFTVSTLEVERDGPSYTYETLEMLAREKGEPDLVFVMGADAAVGFESWRDGEELERRTLASGLELRKVRVRLGVVAVVYEARPNVTIDCAALTIKSGNAIVLRGSSYAERTNGALAAIVREALGEAGLPEDAAVLLAGGGREDLAELATQEDTVDLLIPRGGEGLKSALKDVAKVPVIYAAAGNCHIYVHADADLAMARRIAVNAKTQRPGVCNAAETLLVDAAVAPEFLPGALAELREAGVELVGDERTRASAGGVEVGEAGEEDWASEYLDLKLAVAVVDSVEAAIEHVNAYGTRHSEAIVSRLQGSLGALHGGRQRGGRLHQRLDPLHRRIQSAWGRRSATRPRSCTPAARSACAS